MNTLAEDARLSARIDSDIAQTFREFCDARGEGYSSAIRRLLLTELAKHDYLDEDQKQALGVA